MIIVTGSALIRPESIDEAIEVSLRHVRRSRSEPGCVSHAVHRDVEDDHRLVFVETWADHDALRRHFEVPASLEFVSVLAALTSEPPEMDVYEAERTRV